MLKIIKNLLLSLCCVLSVSVGHAADIALIIDDLGNKKLDAQAFALPSQVTFSILPHKPLSAVFSTRAQQEQREVMLHIPMESLAGNRLGPGGITADMSAESIHAHLHEALLSVPHAIGVNNHMGSKLTQLALPMTTTMDFLRERGLYFVDSRTTHHSKAEFIAKQHGVLTIKRNVFLDHDADLASIDMQFKRLLRLAKKYGKAVGIAHPYPQTIDYLLENLGSLAEQDISLVPLSDLLLAQQGLAKLSKSATTAQRKQALKLANYQAIQVPVVLESAYD